VVPVLGTAAGATIGGLLGAFVPSLTLGVGEVQQAIKEKDEDVSAPEYAFAGGTAIAALDSVLPGKIGSRLARTFGMDVAEKIAQRTLEKPVKDHWLRRGARGAAEGMATEGVTEALQEAVAEVAAARATGQPISDDL